MCFTNDFTRKIPGNIIQPLGNLNMFPDYYYYYTFFFFSQLLCKHSTVKLQSIQKVHIHLKELITILYVLFLHTKTDFIMSNMVVVVVV